MMERMGRSLQASADGLAKANKASLEFARKADLAAELELSRSTVQKFFSGKPIGRENFHQICQRLGLDWRDIAQQTIEISPEEAPIEYGDLNELVFHIRQHRKDMTQARHGTVRVLDMSQPMCVQKIYTNVNLLEKISGRRRIDIDELLKGTDSSVSERPLLTNISELQVPAIEAADRFDKLIILGRPGVGKTTFVKYLLMQCNLGRFRADLIPIFIQLKEFAETPNSVCLLDYIAEQIYHCGIEQPNAAERLLQNGRFLILLDGLDEVRTQETRRMIQDIHQFSMRFPGNRFVMTCRLATCEYVFENFAEVEVADFDQLQIARFARNWFGREKAKIGDLFLERLLLPRNRAIRELAANPLLLTLLCLVFEDCHEFPIDRCGLYKESLNILLRKWDSKRNIERESVYDELMRSHKEALLSQIAWETFERGDYFFQQRELEQQICSYLAQAWQLQKPNEYHSGHQPAHQPAHQLTPQTAHQPIDGEAILKCVEAQHGLLVERARGIYSFCHLTFHEYFAARQIALDCNSHDRAQRLDQLVEHLTDLRWHEIFSLVSGLLEPPHDLLDRMQGAIAALGDSVAVRQVLQGLAKRTQIEAGSEDAVCSPILLRAFYLDLEVARICCHSNQLLDLTCRLDREFTRSIPATLSLDLALDRTLALTHHLELIPQSWTTLVRVLARAIARAEAVDQAQELQRELTQLRADLPQKEMFHQWWHDRGADWTERLRLATTTHRDIGHNWELTPLQTREIKTYYTACCLFIDCLNCAASHGFKLHDHYLARLLLPS